MGSAGPCQWNRRRRFRQILDKATGKQNDFDDELLDICLEGIDDLNQFEQICQSKESNGNDDYLRIEREKFQNWGRTIQTHYADILYPITLQEVIDFVKLARQKKKSVRGAGLRHSWANIFANPENFLVSFYPKEVATGKYRDLMAYVDVIMKDEIYKEKDSLYTIEKQQKIGEKTLVRLGAGVSNEQLRRWCKDNDLEYQANVVMVEVNFCGALAVCAHGSGIKNTPLPDFVYVIQFINCKGELQKISKDKHPDLIKSAAGSMGLLGLIVFVTIQMRAERNAIFRVRKGFGEEIIPRPGTRSERFEYQCMMSYNEWFYFTPQNKIFANLFDTVPKYKGETNAEFPPPTLGAISSAFMGFGKKINSSSLKKFGHYLFRLPYTFMPGYLNPLKKQIKLDFMDAIHFQRGIVNYQCRNFEVGINIPAIEDKLDFQLIQKIWWSGMDYVLKNKDIINMLMEMRICKGSQSLLSPYYGYDYACAIQILRLPIDKSEEHKWFGAIIDIWNIWSNLTDHKGDKVQIHVHWAKEWTDIDKVKKDIVNTKELKENFQNFLEDYEKIAKIGGWDKEEGLKMFSNNIYDEMLDRK